jgi:putative DNA primase/helicase
MPKLKARAEKPVCRQVTRTLVSNVGLALQSMAILPGNTDPPFWIGDEQPFPANEVLPMRNALVHLPGVVTGDMIDPGKFVIAPTPRFFSTYALDFDFDPDAGPPVELFKFLTSIWPDDMGSIEALQEWFGYCLTPDTRQQKIGTFIGPKRSGRGTIARLLKALVGPENVTGPRLSALATNFGLEPLIGKPLAIIGDARLSGRSDKGAIVECMLAISGEDTITIDRKNKSAWTGKLPTRLMLLSNEIPKLPDESGALPSRQLVWKFKESFYGREDLALDSRLSVELPSILLWAIEGWQRLRARGYFLQPKSGEDLVSLMADIASPVGAFVRERVEIGAGFQIIVGDLFAEWCRRCESKKRQTGEEGTFGRNLRTVLPFVETKQRRGDRSQGEKSHVRYFEGIKFRDDDDFAPSGH